MVGHKQPSTKSKLIRHGAVHPTIENFYHGYVADGAKTVGEYALKGLFYSVGKLQGAYEVITGRTESRLGEIATCQCVECECEPCECTSQ